MSMNVPKSEGKCIFCGKTFTKAGINRHLKTHLKQKEAENIKGQSYLIKIESNPYYGSLPYFLSLWVDGEATMEDIDSFLRGIWLECCGHMSDFSSGQVSMSEKVKEVFYKDLKLGYEYDFGSTTELQLTVLGEYSVKAEDEIVLLSRNDPLKWKCDSCNEEIATQICTVHDSMFCDKCGKKHEKECPDFEDYAYMPVVNSPRMGVCGYEGGSIDIERD
ncbi:hypothetical protein MBCUT_10290 [Methanobrevibacter cuticularis]|uniref:Uncharacterized protein n=1 Tax=Methanobrevibacter cuticularis TaxID=47311 RepID=A0A166E148_9EURY|nr:hypothetical protein [Methanobrevibacter cuticularis]KZX16163.1 hypothetical protein MBCUT_10290 [Methanobrevibacter cuticularis]